MFLKEALQECEELLATNISQLSLCHTVTLVLSGSILLRHAALVVLAPVILDQLPVFPGVWRLIVHAWPLDRVLHVPERQPVDHLGW